MRLGETCPGGARRVVSLLLAALLAAGAAAPAAAQTGSPEALVQRGAEAGLDRSQLQEVAERARQRGFSASQTAGLLEPPVQLAEKNLPAGPVLNKTLEGLAKRVPAARMAPVLKTMTDYTERAGQSVDAWLERPEVRETVGAAGDAQAGPPSGNAGPAASSSASARNELIANAARAQQQGVSIEFVESVLNDLPGATRRRPIPMRDVAVAVGILPDLPGAQDGAAPTRELVTAALDAGYDPESLRQLPAALQSARRASDRPPRALAQGAAQAIARGTPAADVLQGLFQGGTPGAGPPTNAGPPGGGQPPGQGKPPGQGGDPPGQGKGPPGGDPPGNGGNPPDNPPGQGGG